MELGGGGGSGASEGIWIKGLEGGFSGGGAGGGGGR